VASSDLDNQEPVVIMSGGIAADVVNGETKADYINRLSVTNYGDFLCEKVNV
jgi:hypothetical protein